MNAASSILTVCPTLLCDSQLQDLELNRLACLILVLWPDWGEEGHSLVYENQHKLPLITHNVVRQHTRFRDLTLQNGERLMLVVTEETPLSVSGVA